MTRDEKLLLQLRNATEVAKKLQAEEEVDTRQRIQKADRSKKITRELEPILKNTVAPMLYGDRDKDVSVVDELDYENLVVTKLASLSIETLKDILEDYEVPPNVRASVARYVLDRVLGTPVQKTQINQTTQNMVLVIGQDIGKAIDDRFIESQGIIRALPSKLR